MLKQHTRVLREIARGIKRSVERPRYLELGIWKAYTFNRVAPFFDEAEAVDIRMQSGKLITCKHSFFCCSTDMYFKTKWDGRMFDTILIDADHHFEQARRDFSNAFQAINENGLILMHDTYPRSEKDYKGCQDAYKVCDWIKGNQTIYGELATLPFYFGITIFRKCRKQLAWQ